MGILMDDSACLLASLMLPYHRWLQRPDGTESDTTARAYSTVERTGSDGSITRFDMRVVHSHPARFLTVTHHHAIRQHERKASGCVSCSGCWGISLKEEEEWLSVSVTQSLVSACGVCSINQRIKTKSTPAVPSNGVISLLPERHRKMECGGRWERDFFFLTVPQW